MKNSNSSTLKCVIADDEYLARTLLADYVGKIPSLELVGLAENAMLATDLLQQHSVDLLFLDIQMPNLTGIELLKSLKNPPTVIFTTAYSEYALEGYQLNVIDYLLKPIPFPRFFEAVTKAIKHIELHKGSQQESRILKENTSSAKPKSYFFVKSDYKILKVNFEEIVYIEGLREYVSIYTEKKRIVSLLSMKELAAETLPNNFKRIHRSHIINIDKITAIQGNTVQIENQSFSIGKSYREAFFKFILEV